MLERIFSILFPVFAVIALGFFAGLRNKAESIIASRVLSTFAFNASIPSLIFLSTAGANLGELAHISYFFTYVIALGLSAGTGTALVYKCANRNLAELPICVMNAAVSNSVYVGLPIVLLAYNNPVPVIIVVFVQVLGVTPLVLYFLEKNSSFGNNGSLKTWIRVLTTPIVVASIAGLVWGLMRWPLQSSLAKTLELLGGAGIPCALVSLGLTLSSEFAAIKGTRLFDVLTLVLAKIFLQPVFAFVVGHYIFHLEWNWLGPLILMAGMPSAINGFVFAKKYNVFVAESSAIVALSTILSFFTLAAIISLLPL